MRLRHLLTLLWGTQAKSQTTKDEYPTFLRIKDSKFSGRYHFVEYSDTNDSPIYKSDNKYIIATTNHDNSTGQRRTETGQKEHLYLGKLNGKGIENWNEPDFWSLNTRQDMFGDYFAQLESTLRVPLYPQNETTLVWKSTYDQSFGQFQITIPDNESCTDTDDSCGAAECYVIGGYRECLCFHGYSYDYTTKTCIDNNECIDLPNGPVCVNGASCVNTDGSYYCETACDGSVEDLDEISEQIVNLDNCDSQLEVNGLTYIMNKNSKQKMYQTIDKASSLCVGKFGWFIAPSCDITTTCQIEFISNQGGSCPDEITTWETFSGSFQYPANPQPIIQSSKMKDCGCGEYGNCNLIDNTCDCKPGFYMEYDSFGQSTGCTPPPVLKIRVISGKKINEKLSGFYLSQWSGDYNQWTFTKRSAAHLMLYYLGDSWRISNTNTITTKMLISFSNGDILSPLSESISCQVFIVK